MNPITEKYFQNDQKFSIETIYNEVFSLEKSQADKLAKDIVDKYNTSKREVQRNIDDGIVRSYWKARRGGG